MSGDEWRPARANRCSAGGCTDLAQNRDAPFFCFAHRESPETPFEERSSAVTDLLAIARELAGTD